jgi:hypothetical protein
MWENSTLNPLKIKTKCCENVGNFMYLLVLKPKQNYCPHEINVIRNDKNILK